MENQNRNIKEGKQPVADDVSDDQNSDDQNTDDQIRFDQNSDDQNSDDQNSDDQIKNTEEGELPEAENYVVSQLPGANELPEATMGLNRSKLRETPFEERRCDAYINHRGPDTKHTLAGVIYHTLHHIGIHAFLDVEELQMGDSIKSVIEEAIRTARVHIAIFSKRYAESPWCLAELSCMLQTESPIIPVLYHVDPSDLRLAAEGRGCYADAFSKHEENGGYTSDMLQEWKMALQRVSYLTDHKMLNRNNGDEGMLLKSIVNSVHANFEPQERQPVADAWPMGLSRRKGKLREKPVEKRPCDVYINHGGPDTKHTLASTIYHALDINKIDAFLSAEELALGDSLPNETREAIETARLHIAIISKSYAESARCLAELSYMLQTGTRIIPVYYNVGPAELRGAALGKGCYAPAFSQHEQQGRYPSNKLQEWKMALQRVSNISGHVLSPNNGERVLLKTIVKAAKEYNSDEGMHLKSKENSVQEQVFRFADWASAFISAALMLVLGSYGLVLSNLLFWMCWTILVVKVVIKAVIYNSYEESEGTTKPHFVGANILKLMMSFVLTSLLLWKEDITKRRNIMLLIIAASVILFEGVTLILRRKKGLSSKTNQKFKDLIFFIPSALNAMMSMTGLIILGGDLGRLMCKQAICGFTFILLVDALAEGIPRVVNGMRFPLVMSEDFVVPKTHHVVFMLRMIVEGCLCGWMGKVVYQVSYFPSNLGIGDCNKLCQERSKHLLITMVALEGLQVVGTFRGYFLCHLLARLHDPTLPVQNVSP